MSGVTERILAAKRRSGKSFAELGKALGRDEVWVAALVYRFYEILQVYGMPLKAVIHEKFGDGIMSAIDFTLTVARQQDPKGDRVQVTMSGKFLPYKKW